MNWRLFVGAAALMFGLAACGDGSSGPGPLSCEGGTSLCGGSCADTETDPRNCGACGVACGDGALCLDGACVDPCPAGQEQCAGGCFTVETSADHCGACGNACATGEACADGQCVTSCPTGQEECNGGCYDLGSDRDNCGACGTTCGAAEACVDGACEAACPTGQSVCDGGCYDLDNTREHCGTCGNVCAAGEVCVEGGCAPTCAEGSTACDGTCRNLDTDVANCGTCGNACGDSQLCVDGSCEVFCASGLVACGDSCRDLENDRTNCGACGTTCGADETCSAGACVPHCAGFASDLCGDTCTNFDTDPANCGACGTVCATGEVCSEGACTGFCAPSLTECSAGCTDLNSDPANCGGCGNACEPAANAAPVCLEGACNAVCMDGFGDCNLDLGAAGGNGCEAPLATSLDHCGGCGIACPAVPNGTRSCVAGGCGIGECADGYLDCDRQLGNGCEINSKTDAANCGACGTVCGANQYCGAGACVDKVPVDTCGETQAVLQAGPNSFVWDATANDYFGTAVPCGTSGTPVGPDLVLKYDSTINGQVTVNLTHTARLYAIITDGVCGGNIRADNLGCYNESSRLSASFNVDVGRTYYVHVIDSSTGSATLPNPLHVNVSELNCADVNPTATALSPANGGRTATIAGKFTASFSHPLDTTAGTFTLTDSQGVATAYAFDHAKVAIASDRRSVTIDTGDLTPGEVVTLTWTGLKDSICGKTIPQQPWVVNIPVPSCAPGTGGMIGTTVTRMPLGLFPGTTLTERAVAADGDPNGFVYVMGSSDLYRVPKAGGRAEDIYAMADFRTAHMGYHLFFLGDQLFSQTASSSSGQLWRLTADGGQTWNAEEAAVFPGSMNFEGAGGYGNEVFLVDGGGPGLTKIWSVDVSGTLPATAQLVTDFANDTSGQLQFCGGLAADARYVYTTCRKGGVDADYVIVRVDRTTGTITELGISPSYETMGSPIHAVDRNADGLADFVYQKGKDAVSRAVCAPAAANYYTDTLVTYGTATSNENGLAYDAGLNALWVYDSSTYELIKIQ